MSAVGIFIKDEDEDGKTLCNPDNATASRRTWIDYFQTDIDPAKATGQLLWCCFLTGWTSVVAWEASDVWVGLQT